MTIELLAPIPARGLVYIWEDAHEALWVINVEGRYHVDESDIRTVLYGPLEEGLEARMAALNAVRDIVVATRRLTR